MKHLFAVYLGGGAEKAYIELHDLVFAVGETIQDTHDQLGKLWFGKQDGLHIDGYIQLDFVDGYEVELIPNTQTEKEENHLYAINLGGYISGNLIEQHEIGFYVAPNKNAAVKKGREELLLGLKSVHRDNIISVDDCLKVQDFLSDYSIKLTRVDNCPPLKIVNCYVVLNPGKY